RERERRQLAQIARVAFDGVRGQAAFHGQVRQIGIHEVRAGRFLDTPHATVELYAMAQRSKWQSLPTEAINQASLALDKLSAVDLVDLMNAEDRKVLSAVQRERERLAI